MIPFFIEIDKVDTFLTRFIVIIADYIPNIISAVITLVIGLIVIKVVRRVITGLMTKKNFDPTFLKFVLDVFTWIFRVLLLISVITKLGVETTSFMTALGAAGLAIGLSLQGSLSNFAGGLLIVMFKPFRVGDYIEAQGQGGTVNSIQIFSTKIITSTNQVVYMPNGTLSNNTIKNFSQEPLRRADIILGVSYNSDLKQVKDVIYKVIENDAKILKTPAPGIEVKDLAENAVNLNIMIWAERGSYGAMVSDFYENIKTAFENAGIEIPFPQRDLHISGGEKTKGLLQ
ncbi:mechanosensitive ion channel protein MscS [Flavobacterium psychrophilum]|nr:mechanosensitive ion channel protein MscS [Flavobacterium psychrophilum]AOE52379.1 mechanosensitive ion channel protein MscS [Flavobacterium psychrophilum]